MLSELRASVSFETKIPGLLELRWAVIATASRDRDCAREYLARVLASNAQGSSWIN